MDLGALGEGQRTWTCRRCGARALATLALPAGGEEHPDRYAEEEAILDLIECPSCHAGPPLRWSVWRIAGEVTSALLVLGSLLAGIFVVVPGVLFWILPVTALVGFVVGLRLEFQRRALARRARLLRLKPGVVPLPLAIAQPGVTATRPRLAPIAAAPPTPVEPTDASEPPRFLGGDGPRPRKRPRGEP